MDEEKSIPVVTTDDEDLAFRAFTFPAKCRDCKTWYDAGTYESCPECGCDKCEGE